MERQMEKEISVATCVMWLPQGYVVGMSDILYIHSPYQSKLVQCETSTWSPLFIHVNRCSGGIPHPQQSFGHTPLWCAPAHQGSGMGGKIHSETAQR